MNEGMNERIEERKEGRKEGRTVCVYVTKRKQSNKQHNE